VLAQGSNEFVTGGVGRDARDAKKGKQKKTQTLFHTHLDIDELIIPL
jgi:hypothetical protein